MLRTRRRCPGCAERVRREAIICRFCGASIEAAPASAKEGGRFPPRSTLIVAGVACTLLIASLFGTFIAPKPSFPENRAVLPQHGRRLPTDAQPVPALPPLSIGQPLEWSASDAPKLIEKSAGALTIRIRAMGSGDEVVPEVEVSVGDDTVRMAGERVAPDATHRITAFINRAGAAPAIMLQSFSGGAHFATTCRWLGCPVVSSGLSTSANGTVTQ